MLFAVTHAQRRAHLCLTSTEDAAITAVDLKMLMRICNVRYTGALTSHDDSTAMGDAIANEIIYVVLSAKQWANTLPFRIA